MSRVYIASLHERTKQVCRMKKQCFKYYKAIKSHNNTNVLNDQAAQNRQIRPHFMRKKKSSQLTNDVCLDKFQICQMRQRNDNFSGHLTN